MKELIIYLRGVLNTRLKLTDLSAVYAPGLNIHSYFLILTLVCLSCSKTPEPDVDSRNTKNKFTAKTSSVVSYNKDTTPSVSSLSTSTVKVALYSIGPLTVQAGDVVSAHLQQEITTESTQHVMIGSYIVAATSSTSTTADIGSISKASTSNLDPSSEGSAEIVTRTGSYKFTSAATNVYINAVFYASSLTNPPSPNLTIPSGAYGELVAVVESGVTTYNAAAYQSTLPYNSSLGKHYAPATSVVQYSVGPLNVPSQTMVDVRYQIEATSEKASALTATHRLGRRVVYGSSATATSGVDLVPASQGGIPRHYEHHHTSSHAGGAFFSTAASNAFFNSVVYSKNVVSPDILIVEPPHYGHFVVEMRPYNGFWQDIARNITSVTSTGGQVLYSIGPIDVTAGELYEIRYKGVFAPTAMTPFTSKIIRGTSATATSGVTVQPPLWRKFAPEYYYTNAIHSTAEQIATSATGQYYNVVVNVPSGGSLPVQDWGELEVVRR